MSRFTIKTFIILCVLSCFAIAPSFAQLQSAFMPLEENVIRDYCQSTQRVIAGAIEMYNMDHDEPLVTLEDKMIREPGQLIPKYIGEPVAPDNGCSYSSKGDLLKDGFVFCSIHGAEAQTNREAQVFEDFKNAAQKLLGAGKKVDGTDEDRATALHMAVELEEPLIVEYLLSLKANPALKNNKGRNALDLAVEKQNLPIARILKAAGASCSHTVVDPSKKPLFHPGFDAFNGKVEVKSGDEWKPLDTSATYSVPLTLRTSSQSHVSISLGKIDYSYLNLNLDEFEELIGNGLSLDLGENTELVMEQPVFDHDFPIVTGLPFALKQGEIRLSTSGLVGEAGIPTVKLGKNIFVTCQPGAFKLAYDAKQDSGKIVVKIGSLIAKENQSSQEGLELTGFYKVNFEKGKLGNRHQADIAEEFQ